MSSEKRDWRVEVLWRTTSRLDNATVEGIAEAAEAERDWLVSRWEDRTAFGGDGVYLTAYRSSEDPDVAAAVHSVRVREWMRAQGIEGGIVEAAGTDPEIARHRAEAPTVPELVSASDAAGILEVSRQRVAELARTHPDFPAPITEVATGPLWTRPAIEAFAAARARTPGRPRRNTAA